jgi:hypothetical protein
MIDVVGLDFGTTWRGRGWPLFYDHVGTCVVPHATDYLVIPIWWDGFSA